MINFMQQVVVQEIKISLIETQKISFEDSIYSHSEC